MASTREIDRRIQELSDALGTTGLVNCKEQIAHFPNIKRDARRLFAERKRLAATLSHCNSTNALKMCQRLDRCASNHAVFGHKRMIGKFQILPLWCNSRFCPVCAPVEIFRNAKRFHAAFRGAKHKPLKFLTLTVKNVATQALQDALRRLSSAWLRFAKDHAERELGCQGYLQKREVTFNAKDSTWHPHIHAIMDMGYTNRHDLTRRWNLCASNQGFEVSDASTQISAIHESTAEKAAYECAVYCSKPVTAAAASSQLWSEIIDAWHGQRSYASSGTLRLKPIPSSGDWEYLDILTRYIVLCNDQAASDLVDAIPMRNEFEAVAFQESEKGIVAAIEKRFAFPDARRPKKP